MSNGEQTAYVTPAEHDALLALQDLDLTVLAKMLATMTEKERELSRQLNQIKARADVIEETVMRKMIDADMPSITTEYTDDGKRMKLSISSKSYPKMINGSKAAALALEAYAARLRASGRDDDAAVIEDMLTIKGQSLQPMLTEWMIEEIDLPPEFAGAIEPSTKMSLSKTAVKPR